MTQTQVRPPATDGDAAGALAVQPLRGQQAAFVSNPAFRLAQNAVTHNSVDDVALNQRVVFETDHTFSTLLDDWGVTNQKQTGRCWMFAGLNLLRFAARKTLDVKEFEFSQNYLMFWDKVERANYFFEAIIDAADRDTGDRSIAFLLDQPLSDGGQWNMFINLVRKHGLVPKACMPETDSSSNSRRMNGVLRSKLREGARRLRDMHSHGASLDELRATKQEYLRAVNRISEHPSRHAARALRLAVARQGQRLPSDRRADAAGICQQVRGPAAGRVRVPGPRPTAVQSARPNLYRPVPRQRRGRAARHVSERRDGNDEAHRPAHARGRRAGLVWVRRRQTDAPGHLA